MNAGTFAIVFLIRRQIDESIDMLDIGNTVVSQQLQVPHNTQIQSPSPSPSGLPSPARGPTDLQLEKVADSHANALEQEQSKRIKKLKMAEMGLKIVRISSSALTARALTDSASSSVMYHNFHLHHHGHHPDPLHHHHLPRRRERPLGPSGSLSHHAELGVWDPLWLLAVDALRRQLEIAAASRRRHSPLGSELVGLATVRLDRGQLLDFPGRRSGDCGGGLGRGAAAITRSAIRWADDRPQVTTTPKRRYFFMSIRGFPRRSCAISRASLVVTITAFASYFVLGVWLRRPISREREPRRLHYCELLSSQPNYGTLKPALKLRSRPNTDDSRWKALSLSRCSLVTASSHPNWRCRTSETS